MSGLTVVLSGLLAALFTAAGAVTIAEYPVMRNRAARLGVSTEDLQAIGSLEIAASLGLVIGLVSRPVGAAAAGGLALLMAGAVALHIRAGDRAAQFAAALVLGVAAAVDALAQLGSP